MPDSSSLGALIALAILTEATVQILFLDIPAPLNKLLSWIYKTENRICPSTLQCISALVGIAYAFNMGLDIFIILGYPSRVPGLGIIATGIIASRGTYYVKDILTRLVDRQKSPAA